MEEELYQKKCKKINKDESKICLLLNIEINQDNVIITPFFYHYL
jgi:hypothetical protein